MCTGSRGSTATGFCGLISTVSLGASAAMLDIARSEVVPGANDNLSAVGVLLAVARSLQDNPISGVRVLLISTGSEESFSEGMQAFGERHFSELDRARTEFLCLECLGGPTLIVCKTVIGWGAIGTCPGLKGGSCSNAISNCNDIATCLTCVGQSAAVSEGNPPSTGSMPNANRWSNVR